MQERCDYSTQKNKLIRDRLVLEIRDVWPCPKKLQMEGQTDSEMVTLMLRQAEEVGRGVSKVHGGGGKEKAGDRGQRATRERRLAKKEQLG